MNSVFKNLSDVISVCSGLTFLAGMSTVCVSDFLFVRNAKFSQKLWALSHLRQSCRVLVGYVIHKEI